MMTSLMSATFINGGIFKGVFLHGGLVEVVVDDLIANNTCNSNSVITRKGDSGQDRENPNDSPFCTSESETFKNGCSQCESQDSPVVARPQKLTIAETKNAAYSFTYSDQSNGVGKKKVPLQVQDESHNASYNKGGILKQGKGGRMYRTALDSPFCSSSNATMNEYISECSCCLQKMEDINSETITKGGDHGPAIKTGKPSKKPAAEKWGRRFDESSFSVSKSTSLLKNGKKPRVRHPSKPPKKIVEIPIKSWCQERNNLRAEQESVLSQKAEILRSKSMDCKDKSVSKSVDKSLRSKSMDKTSQSTIVKSAEPTKSKSLSRSKASSKSSVLSGKRSTFTSSLASSKQESSLKSRDEPSFGETSLIDSSTKSSEEPSKLGSHGSKFADSLNESSLKVLDTCRHNLYDSQIRSLEMKGRRFLEDSNLCSTGIDESFKDGGSACFCEAPRCQSSDVASLCSCCMTPFPQQCHLNGATMLKNNYYFMPKYDHLVGQ